MQYAKCFGGTFKNREAPEGFGKVGANGNSYIKQHYAATQHPFTFPVCAGLPEPRKRQCS